MAETTSEERSEWMDAIVDEGEVPGEREVESLIMDAELAEQLEEAVNAIEQALQENGMALINITTDEDETQQWEIVRMEDA